MSCKTERHFVTSGVCSDVRDDGRTRVEVRTSFKVSNTSNSAPEGAGSASASIDYTTATCTIVYDVAESTEPSLHLSMDLADSAVAALAGDKAQATLEEKLRLNSLLVEIAAAVVGLPLEVAADTFTGAVSSSLATSSSVAANTIETSNVSAMMRRRPRNIDVAQLKIGKKHCFDLRIHVSVLEARSGNVATAVSLALNGALRSLRLPVARESAASANDVHVELDDTERFRLNVEDDRLPIVVHLRFKETGGFYVVDPSLLEEAVIPGCFLAAVIDKNSNSTTSATHADSSASCGVGNSVTWMKIFGASVDVEDVGTMLTECANVATPYLAAVAAISGGGSGSKNNLE